LIQLIALRLPDQVPKARVLFVSLIAALNDQHHDEGDDDDYAYADDHQRPRQQSHPPQ
jgi:hypothetical protein